MRFTYWNYIYLMIGIAIGIASMLIEEAMR